MLLAINKSFQVLESQKRDLMVNDEITESAISADVSSICYWIIFPVLCQTVCLFGIGSNVINIICFINQGFQDPVSVSLSALAMSDIGCLISSTVVNIFFTPAFREADFSLDALEVSYLTGGMLRTIFSRITAWFTALITLERCLCITIPLKIKSIITSKRMATVLLIVFIFLMASSAPVYAVNSLGMKYFPPRNKTLLGLLHTNDAEKVEHISFAINNAFLPFAAFVIITVCTSILVVMLNGKTKWRKKSTNFNQIESISARNKKVAKMVVIISSIFIACFVPLSFMFLGICLVPGFSPRGKYRDLLSITGGACFTLESVNSSVNIFIYYKMSSKYKIAFRKLFGVNRDDQWRN